MQLLIKQNISSHLNFECEILLHVLDNHNEKGQFDAEGLLGICRACDVRGGHVGAQDLQD